MSTTTKQCTWRAPQIFEQKSQRRQRRHQSFWGLRVTTVHMGPSRGLDENCQIQSVTHSLRSVSDLGKIVFVTKFGTHIMAPEQGSGVYPYPKKKRKRKTKRIVWDRIARVSVTQVARQRRLGLQNLRRSDCFQASRTRRWGLELWTK